MGLRFVRFRMGLWLSFLSLLPHGRTRFAGLLQRRPPVFGWAVDKLVSVAFGRTAPQLPADNLLFKSVLAALPWLPLCMVLFVFALPAAA